MPLNSNVPPGARRTSCHNCDKPVSYPHDGVVRAEARRSARRSPRPITQAAPTRNDCIRYTALLQQLSHHVRGGFE
ncbi:hypothetical protein WR43_15230 [Mycolicibacter arupensis]|uniref:Uncharacterized protein n=1 Tax=Mycolicibacter arupensis TaxID=342002 RepID=A0A0F5MW83_9MYCO|nr:hypothetical protein WR43_15230 [Mycolicibacter arupensis]